VSGLSAVLAVAIAVLAVVFLGRGSTAPPPPPPPAAPPAAAPPPAASEASAPHDPVDETARRALPTALGRPELDPEIRASLTGFKGRVLDARKQPVADTGVRIYRASQDAVLPDNLDLFADTVAYEPHIVAGETKTAADGTFAITGVWPRAFHLLFAGIGSDAPSHRLLPHSPGPGEIVDLGDIALDDAAVLTGIAVDEDDHPVEGALVRAVDLPALVTTFFPFERLDPDSVLLARDGPPVPVIEFPAWVKSAWEHLPIPSTRSGADGAFRLVGITPGNNLMAVVKPGLLAEVRGGLQLKPAEVHDLGKVRLKRGEELTGKVVAGDGKPVAGAEVVAGNVSHSAPIDVARRIGTTDAQGRFAAEGFQDSNVSVAARRSPRDPWVVVASQSIRREVVLTLPAQHSVTVRVTDPAGAVVKSPELRLFAGGRDEAATMAVLGFARPIDLRGRVEKLEDGRLRIGDFDAGSFVLFARAEGLAMGSAHVDLEHADAEVAIQLAACVEYVVRVVGPDAAPIRNAGVWVHEQGQGQRNGMPFLAGRTGADGRVVVAQTGSDKLRVTADHPRWGFVHGEIARGAGELVLAMQVPGWVEGTLLDHGKPPLPAKYTVSLEGRGGPLGDRGALDVVPLLATPAQDGAFAFKALQPGRYHLTVLSSLEALTSPGGVMRLVEAQFVSGDLPREDVEIVPGAGARVALDVAKEQYTGATARLFGTATVNGRPAAGATLMMWSDHGRRVTLKEGEQQELRIEVATTSMSGVVVDPEGKPVAHAWVQVRGHSLEPKPGDDEFWNGTQTDEHGAFELPRARAGIYRFTVGTNGEQPLRGQLDDVRADGLAPVTGLRIQTNATITVAGRLDTSVFPRKPDWMGMTFIGVDPAHPEKRSDAGWAQVQDDGAFTTNEIGAGTYEVRLYAGFGDADSQEYEVPGRIEVPPQGVRDLYLRPVKKQPEPPRKGR
jgi:protocatechuate 3,4-dioxygenase beta subunit